MSQVKNLRAMFEGKGDTSPPDRGRSSGASTPVPGVTGSDSPRPLSKVRTSFVAIEKDGRIGLRRDQSHESSASRRRLSMETDSESTTSVPDKPSVALEEPPKVSKPVLHETIPESPRQPPEVEKKINDAQPAPKKPTTPIEEISHLEKSVQAKLETSKTESPKTEAPEPAKTAPKSPIKEPKAPIFSAAVNGKAKAQKPKEPVKVPAKEPVKEPAKEPIKQPVKESAANTPAKTTAVKKTARPAAIATNKPAPKPAAKSPLKTPSSASDKGTPKQTVKAHDKPVAKKEPTTTKAASTTRHTATTATKKPQPLKPTPSDTGFVKPKPKSPTKPVHLPSSLTAPTASSVSKGAASRQTQVRSTANTGNLNVPGRSPSRASVSTTTSTGKTVKRQPSSINRSRPSLGPPPVKKTDASAKKEAAPVDEGFLARMMRPTQASSSKTTEKAPVTPPRKKAQRPSLGAEGRRDHHVKAPGSAKKTLRRQAGSSVASRSVHSKESSPAPMDESAVISEPDHIVESANTEPAEQIAEPVEDDESAPVSEPKGDIVEPAHAEELVQDIPVPETVNEVVEPVQEEEKPIEPVEEENPTEPAQEQVPSQPLNAEEPAVEAVEEEPAFTGQPEGEEVKTHASEPESAGKTETEPKTVAEPETETEKIVEVKEPESQPTTEEPKEVVPVAEDKPVDSEASIPSDVKEEVPVTKAEEAKEPAEEIPEPAEVEVQDLAPTPEAEKKEEMEIGEEEHKKDEKKDDSVTQ